MKIGILKEIKNSEYRVSCVPASAAELVNCGHEVIVESKAGEGSGFKDEEYIKVGCIIEKEADNIWKNVDLVYKVKEILPEEYKYLREELIVLTYIHSNAHKDQTEALMKSKCISIAYEDISDDKGEWPLLSPMSELAGKGGFLAALYYSQSVNGGNGRLLSNVCGVETPIISIIGCGHSGRGACELASSFGNRVNMLDVSYEAMLDAKKYMGKNVEFLLSNRENMERCLKTSDVLINCILWPKTRTDHLVFKDDLKMMKPGAIIVDVACDDEGAIETCHSTSHDDPIYEVDGIVHYCVDNIPSAFSRTASTTLSNATLPFAKEIANKGVIKALEDNKHLRRGLTTFVGKLTLKETAEKLGIEFTAPEEAIKMKGGKIAILKWESGFVPMGLMQLESLTGNSTNIDSYPFDVKFQEIEGANIETILLNPSQVILNRMIDVSKEMIKNEGVNAISTSCGFNAIFQKQLAKELTVPVFSSALLQVPMVCNMIGTDKTVGIITANKESLTKEHLSECGVTDEMNYVVKGLEDYHEWSKIFNNPNEKFNMEVVKNEILDAAKNLYESNPELGAIVLECTDLPPFADFIREETGLPVFDFNSLAVYVALGVGAFKAY